MKINENTQIGDTAKPLKNLLPYVLYHNEQGSNEEITILDDSANYEYIDLLFRNDGYFRSSVRVKNPNGKNVNCSIIYQENSSYMWLYSAIEFIHGTKITPYHGGIVSLITTGISDTRNRIFLETVIGWK